MATPQQYAFFKDLHDSEEKRYSYLHEKAKFYLAISAGYVTFVVTRPSDAMLTAERFNVPATAMIAGVAIMAAGLMFTVAAMSIRRYDRVADPEELIRNLGDAPLEDDDFLDDRIVDFAVATNVYFKANNRTATLLLMASWCIATATLLQVGMLVSVALTSVVAGG